MATSDYAHMAFDKDAVPTIASLEVNGKIAEIYKNWLYVRNKRSGKSIATIYEGDMHIDGFDIVAERTEIQNAMFVLVRHVKYHTPKNPKKNQTKKVHMMAGIGCCGYDNKTDKLCKHFNINPDDYVFVSMGWSNFDRVKNKMSKTGLITLTAMDDKGDFKEFCIPENKKNKAKFDSKWVGITPKIYKMFLEFLNKNIDDYDEDQKKWLKKIKKIKLNDAKFYNQGDKYFMDHGIDTGDISQSLKEKKTPIAMQIIDKTLSKEQELV